MRGFIKIRNVQLHGTSEAALIKTKRKNYIHHYPNIKTDPQFCQECLNKGVITVGASPPVTVDERALPAGALGC